MVEYNRTAQHRLMDEGAIHGGYGAFAPPGTFPLPWSRGYGALGL